MVELLANSGDPDQTPRSAASDLGLHCLPVIRLGSSVFNELNTQKSNHNASATDKGLLKIVFTTWFEILAQTPTCNILNP